MDQLHCVCVRVCVGRLDVLVSHSWRAVNLGHVIQWIFSIFLYIRYFGAVLVWRLQSVFDLLGVELSICGHLLPSSDFRFYYTLNFQHPCNRSLQPEDNRRCVVRVWGSGDLKATSMPQHFFPLLSVSQSFTSVAQQTAQNNTWTPYSCQWLSEAALGLCSWCLAGIMIAMFTILR